MGIEVSGVLGLLVLILDIWALLKIIQSGATTGNKVVWILVILLLPIIGLILWWLLGPRSGRATAV